MKDNIPTEINQIHSIRSLYSTLLNKFHISNPKATTPSKNVFTRNFASEDVYNTRLRNKIKEFSTLSSNNSLAVSINKPCPLCNQPLSKNHIFKCEPTTNIFNENSNPGDSIETTTILWWSIWAAFNNISHSTESFSSTKHPTKSTDFDEIILINGNLPVILKSQINILSQDLQTTLTNIKFTDKKWNSRFSPFDLIMNNRKFKQVFKYKLELERNRFNQVMEKQENELDEENEENEEIMELGTPETQSFMDSGTPETQLDIDLVNNIIV